MGSDGSRPKLSDELIAFVGGGVAASIDRALASLIKDGTVERIQRRWLSTDLSKLAVLG